MAEAAYAPNNVINPETGFIENPAYIYAFDSNRKQQFIKCLVENGLGIYEACEALGLSHHTLFKHYHNDPKFKEALDEARNEYGARLDSLSKRNAMNPRSVIERIFQLKSIFPEKYADQRQSNQLNITINVDENLIENARKREQILEAQQVTEVVDNQVDMSASNKQISSNPTSDSQSLDHQ